jgi:hypothetical protein
MSHKTESLREQFEGRSTEDLISILRNRNEDEWRPEVFEVVAAVLKDRGRSPDEVIALGPESHEAMESEPPITLATFFSPAEAHGSRNALEQAGIGAWVADEAAGTMYGVGVGTRLQVSAKDVEAAREVLSSAAAPAGTLPPDIAEPACPACGSPNVAPEARLDETGLERRKWYFVCGDCRKAWSL